MKTLKLATALLFLLMCSGLSASALTGKYANVNGMKIYYTMDGNGPAIVLLHGAFSTIEKDFGKIIPTLAKDHTVIGIELQGHGHTSDIDRPFSYEAFAGDVVELLKQLKITKADFLGYSMGGGTAIQVAIGHPELVRHLMLEAADYSPEGMNMDNPDKLTPKPQTDLNQSVWKKNYDLVAPDKTKWPELMKKVFASMGTWKGFKAKDIKGIKSPTLLIFGDADMSKPEHQIAMFRLLGGGNSGDLYQIPNEQLAILPGTTRVNLVDQTDLLIPIVSRFLKTADSR